MISGILMATALTAEVPIDKVAHFGVSWAINHTTYSVCKKLVDNKTGCLIGAIATTVAVGVAKEVIDGNKNSGNEHTYDMAADAAGIALSSLMITLEW